MLIPVSIGRQSFDADPRVARVILWLLSNQRLLSDDTVKLTVDCSKASIKYSVQTFHLDQRPDVA